MENAKEIFKNLLYIFVTVFCMIIIIFIIIIIGINIKSFFNIGEKQSNNEQIINILSLNLGILQGLTGVIGIGIGIAAYFNFTTIREKLKEIDKKLKEHDEKIYKKPNNKKTIIKEED